MFKSEGSSRVGLCSLGLEGASVLRGSQAAAGSLGRAAPCIRHGSVFRHARNAISSAFKGREGRRGWLLSESVDIERVEKWSRDVCIGVVKEKIVFFDNNISEVVAHQPGFFRNSEQKKNASNEVFAKQQR